MFKSFFAEVGIKRPFKNRLAGLVAKVSELSEELRQHADAEAAKADDLAVRAVELQEESLAAYSEAGKANRIADRLDKLVA